MCDDQEEPKLSNPKMTKNNRCKDDEKDKQEREEIIKHSSLFKTRIYC